MDTNPFANNNQQQAAAPTGQPQMTTAPGGIAAMIKAIMEGNDAYKQRMQQQQQARGQPQAGAQPGQPLSLSPPQDPMNPSGTGTSQPIPLPSSPTASSMPPPPSTGPQTGGLGASSAFTSGTSPVPATGGFAGMPTGGFASMLSNQGMGGGLASMLGGSGSGGGGMGMAGGGQGLFGNNSGNMGAASLIPSQTSAFSTTSPDPVTQALMSPIPGT